MIRHASIALQDGSKVHVLLNARARTEFERAAGRSMTEYFAERASSDAMLATALHAGLAAARRRGLGTRDWSASEVMDLIDEIGPNAARTALLEAYRLAMEPPAGAPAAEAAEGKQ